MMKYTVTNKNFMGTTYRQLNTIDGEPLGVTTFKVDDTGTHITTTICGHSNTINVEGVEDMMAAIEANELYVVQKMAA